MDFADVFSGLGKAYSDYNATKQATANAKAAEMAYQTSVNNASLSQKLAGNKTILVAIGGVVAVIVAFFIFKK